MTKRAPGKFKRRKQDAYDTPPEAVVPLLGHLPDGAYYMEPCAGDGSLIRAMRSHRKTKRLTCVARGDVEPRDRLVRKADALNLTHADVKMSLADYIITNPPWTREILHPMIDHFAAMRPTWLLFDADWMHTKQARPYLTKCVKIVSVGRVSWMQNGTSGLDNCAWYLFDADHNGTPPLFFGRRAG